MRAFLASYLHIQGFVLPTICAKSRFTAKKRDRLPSSTTSITGSCFITTGLIWVRYLSDYQHWTRLIYWAFRRCGYQPSRRSGIEYQHRAGRTIGAASRGPRTGAPTLEDRVWVGANAIIVGKVTIGREALIAPGAYVNFDVPPESVVLGNPGKVVSNFRLPGIRQSNDRRP